MAEAFVDLSGLGGRSSRQPLSIPKRAQSVLLGLLRNPRDTDRALGHALNLAPSVVGELRRGLVAEGLLTPIRYPSLSRLRLDAYAVLVARTPPHASWEASRLAYARFARETSSVLVAALGPRSCAYLVGLRRTEDLGEIRTRLQALSAQGAAPSLRVSAPAVIPARASGLTPFPAFGTVVASLLGEDTSQRSAAIGLPALQTSEEPLPRHRAAILRELLKAPPRSDQAIARELGLSRQAIGKARADLAEEGWFSELWVPALGLLRGEVAAFLQAAGGRPGSELEGAESARPSLESRTLLGFWGPAEGALVAIWDRFETLERTLPGLASAGCADWLDLREPSTAIFPLAETALLLRADLSGFLEKDENRPNP